MWPTMIASISHTYSLCGDPVAAIQDTENTLNRRKCALVLRPPRTKVPGPVRGVTTAVAAVTPHLCAVGGSPCRSAANPLKCCRPVSTNPHLLPHKVRLGKRAVAGPFPRDFGPVIREPTDCSGWEGRSGGEVVVRRVHLRHAGLRRSRSDAARADGAAVGDDPKGPLVAALLVLSDALLGWVAGSGAKPTPTRPPRPWRPSCRNGSRATIPPRLICTAWATTRRRFRRVWRTPWWTPSPRLQTWPGIAPSKTWITGRTRIVAGPVGGFGR